MNTFSGFITSVEPNIVSNFINPTELEVKVDHSQKFYYIGRAGSQVERSHWFITPTELGVEVKIVSDFINPAELKVDVDYS